MYKCSKVLIYFVSRNKEGTESPLAQWKRIRLGTMRLWVRVLASRSGLSVVMSCGVGHRCGSNLVLLWLWCRLAAVAPTGPIAWEPPHALGAALKSKKKKKKQGGNN